VSEYRFELPDVGEGLAEAAVSRWIVAEGQTVRRMEPIVELETAKSVVEIPSPVAGVLTRHGAREGESLDVGAVLAVIATADAAPAGPPASAPAPDRSAPRRAPASPSTRRLAARKGVDLAQVTATGPGGRILAADVEAHLAAPSTTTPTSTTSEPTPAAPAVRRTAGDGRDDVVSRLTPLRQTIATTLANAWSTVPLITDLRDVDAVGLVGARTSIAHELGRPVSYTALFARATVAALGRHPAFNASLDLDAGTMTQHGAVHLGIAVATPGGLSVAVVRDADLLSLPGLADEIARLADAARAGRLSPAEASGATFTVSSFGQFGGWYGTPLVVPPQVAIAGFGPIADKVVAHESTPAVRATLALSVSADHRLLDGADLSGFCSTLERLLADPVRLWAY
jgi:pyruvate dehydrogenase E2 component (dihydrolipoamide acetyltransferase)